MKSCGSLQQGKVLKSGSGCEACSLLLRHLRFLYFPVVWTRKSMAVYTDTYIHINIQRHICIYIGKHMHMWTYFRNHEFTAIILIFIYPHRDFSCLLLFHICVCVCFSGDNLGSLPKICLLLCSAASHIWNSFRVVSSLPARKTNVLKRVQDSFVISSVSHFCTTK